MGNSAQIVHDGISCRAPVWKQDTCLDGHCHGNSHVSLESCSSLLNNWDQYLHRSPLKSYTWKNPTSELFPRPSASASLDSQSVSHTQAWGSSRSCFQRRLHSCSAGLAAAAARLRAGCCVEPAGVLSTSFHPFCFSHPSALSSTKAMSALFPGKRGHLSFPPKSVTSAVIARLWAMAQNIQLAGL